MIVDKILAYLNTQEKTVDEGLLSQVSLLSRWTFKRQFMEERNRPTLGKLYLSSCGKCPRQLAYGYLGFEKNGKEMDARAAITFWQGDLVELMLLSLAKQAGCQITSYGLNQNTVKLKVGDVEIQGHPDGLCLDGGIRLIEVKSMSSYSFERFEKGSIDESYLDQVNAYMAPLGLTDCIFVAMNKDNGILHEIMVPYDAERVAKIRERLWTVIESDKEHLPERPYVPDKKDFWPWQCAYCGFFGTCLVNEGLAERVLVNSSYKLKFKPKEEVKPSGN